MPVAPFDKIIQNAAENLYGDERLRSNLADDEAKIVLDWALGRISAQVNAAHDEAAAKLAAQKELARVRPVIAAINALAKKPGTPRLADAVAAVESSLAAPPLSRAETMALLTAIADKLWQARSKPPTK
jgi:hypothetical protein